MRTKIMAILLAIGFNALNGAAGIHHASQWRPAHFNNVIIENRSNATINILGFITLTSNSEAVISLPIGNNLANLLDIIPTSGRTFAPVAPTTLNDEILPFNRITFWETQDPHIINVTMETFQDVLDDTKAPLFQHGNKPSKGGTAKAA